MVYRPRFAEELTAETHPGQDGGPVRTKAEHRFIEADEEAVRRIRETGSGCKVIRNGKITQVARGKCALKCSHFRFWEAIDSLIRWESTKVERSGFEPLTPCMPCKCSTN